MRLARITLCLLALLAGPALAQAPAQPIPFAVPRDGTILRIDRVEGIPPQLLAAINRQACRLDEALMRGFPIELFRPTAGSRPMALVTCEAIAAYGHAFVFERGTRDEPTLLHFPVVMRPQGFTTSERPGIMHWNPESRTITAVSLTDLCNEPRGRHSYRHGRASGLKGFVLIRVEYARSENCEPVESDWKTLWEAPEWVIPD